MMTATKRGRSSPSTPTKRQARRPAEITAAVRPLAEQVATAHGLVLWGVTFLRDAGQQTLRVACDRVGGVTADELGALAEQLSREIDRADIVPGEQRYVLEVTSPGAERKLERPDQYEVCVGRVAKVVLKDGRTIDGEIAGTTGRAVEIRSGDETVRALFDDIARAQLVVKL
jgi:ribosome maturation factor RimP